jgi:hypothetical protein
MLFKMKKIKHLKKIKNKKKNSIKKKKKKTERDLIDSTYSKSSGDNIN